MAEPQEKRMIHEGARVASELLRLSNADQRIADHAPEGDPQKTTRMISSRSTIWGIKFEGMLSLARGFEVPGRNNSDGLQIAK